MIRAMWTAATGMTAQQINVDTIAHNLANVNTNSFKRSRAEFADLLYQVQRMPGTNASNVGVFPVGIQIGAGVRPVTVAKEWMQGNMRQTSNELDMAIDGAGFFQVSRPDGTVMYTRNGSFKRDNVGNLVTGDGDLLNPVITIPSGALKLDIGQDPSGLVAMGSNLFLDSFASGPPLQGTGGFSTGFGTIQQGFLESSNVNLAEEMVNMIIAQRSYEINSKTIQASDEMMSIANNLKR
jgi:flagellar basal-body rod protein FlgG